MTPPSVPTADPPSERPGADPDVSAEPAGAEPVGDPSDPQHAGAESLDGAEPLDQTVRSTRSRRRRWLWGGVGLAVLAVLAGVLFIPTPYYLFQPGSVRPAETRIDVSGAPSYTTDGDVMFTTVYVDQASLATLLRGVIDDAVEIRSEEDVYGPEGRDASRRANQQRMDLSKLIATKVALQYLGYPAEFTGRGARVLGVAEGGGSVGKLRVGDVITSVDGHDVRLPSDIQAGLRGKVPGDTVEVTARRGSGKDVTTVSESITLGSARTEDDAASTTTRPPGSTTSSTVGSDGAAASPAEATPGVRPVLGISVEPDAPSVDSPVRVDIDSGDVTGPSAGLAWALAVVDRMTPESLTDGKEVAVTGEILPDGTVGPIGGIVQKVAAVKRAGVRTFLYPEATPDDEERQMREVAGGGVRLVPVRTLDDAVVALHPGGVRRAN